MAKSKFDKETYLFWYEQMYLMRRFEERAGQLYGMQKIKGFCHLYIGQEAVMAGAMTTLRKEDAMITAYRDHAHALAKGISANEVMAELYGKAFFGGHGIVGGQIPLGAGIAFSEKYLGTDHVCVCYMGDGAVRQGAFHEALNMAMTWKLPVIFIIENNSYAMGTSVERTSNVTNLFKLGLAYDMPSEPVDGMDPEAVHLSMEKAIARARKGDGPTLLEMETYRFKGHSMSDPAKYRTKEEVEEYKQKDPIEIARQRIIKSKWATEADLEAINTRVNAVVEESVRFAEESPYPTPDELFKDVYSDPYPYIVE